MTITLTCRGLDGDIIIIIVDVNDGSRGTRKVGVMSTVNIGTCVAALTV